MSLTLPNLNFFGFGENDFSGSIPNSLFNASRFEIINLGWNEFAGQVPMNIRNLKNLDFIEIIWETIQLIISEKFWGGSLPNSVSNQSIELDLLYF